jgi:anti-sigma B factor antagonist
MAGPADPSNGVRRPLPEKFLPPPFRIDIDRSDGEVRVCPVGELDMSTVGQMETALKDAARAGRHVIVDLRGLEFMDSTGLTLLTRWSLASERDGFELALVSGNERIHRLFEITRLVAHFRFVTG